MEIRAQSKMQGGRLISEGSALSARQTGYGRDLNMGDYVQRMFFFAMDLSRNLDIMVKQKAQVFDEKYCT